jgi:hypothetical protein
MLFLTDEIKETVSHRGAHGIYSFKHVFALVNIRGMLDISSMNEAKRDSVHSFIGN